MSNGQYTPPLPSLSTHLSTHTSQTAHPSRYPSILPPTHPPIPFKCEITAREESLRLYKTFGFKTMVKSIELLSIERLKALSF
jgi:hypothetical protein